MPAPSSRRQWTKVLADNGPDRRQAFNKFDHQPWRVETRQDARSSMPCSARISQPDDNLNACSARTSIRQAPPSSMRSTPRSHQPRHAAISASLQHHRRVLLDGKTVVDAADLKLITRT